MESEYFQAFRIHAKQSEQGYFQAGIEKLCIDDLTEGDVVIRVQYSAINYKDALAGTGRAPILRKSPLNGGIDLVGTVVQSDVAEYQEGDCVFAQGSGLSEKYDGGFAQYARLPCEILLPLPQGLTPIEMITIGTAGFTAALSIHQMEINGQRPESGEILVTGASGGVGSMAVHLLSELGYRCVASTHKQTAHAYLHELGADRVIGRLVPGQGALAKQKWAGVIDNLGGETLACALSETCAYGNVVSVGMAQSSQLALTVMPFIIRGVKLLGVSSANYPMDLRKKIWCKYAQVWKKPALARMIAGQIGLPEVPAFFERLLKGEVQGRYVVNLDSPI